MYYIQQTTTYSRQINHTYLYMYNLYQFNNDDKMGKTRVNWTIDPRAINILYSFIKQARRTSQQKLTQSGVVEYLIINNLSNRRERIQSRKREIMKEYNALDEEEKLIAAEEKEQTKLV